MDTHFNLTAAAISLRRRQPVLNAASLTDAELKIVNLIAQGATNRAVATQLHLSLHTVKTHVHNAFAKLGINSRAQLTQLMHGSD
jgi:DNA-binding CsgD family transcriptional regulator